MRDILFKAKRIDNGEWVVGSYALHPKGNCSISVILDKCKNPPDCDPMWQKVLISHEVDPNTICQYTGLTDKNGNKIWENDIVMLDDELWVVKWSDNDAQFTVEYDCTIEHFGNVWSMDCEVYSNTIDNPELIGE